MKINKIAKLGLLAAISIILVQFIHFPIIPGASYLEYDVADIPILIGAFLYGPVAGILLTLIVSVIQGMTVSAGSGWVGIVMHFFATSTLVLIASILYKYKHNLKWGIIGLILGSIGMILIMIPLNLIFTVHFFGYPQKIVEASIVPVIIPFNAFKAVVNSLLTIILYKRIGKLLKVNS
ncbi:MAG: ECF transporter S component [Clostridiales bacterium 43-6]|nr:MAG: ECF transporter S component [Clostridiales bacterium 43-6]